MTKKRKNDLKTSDNENKYYVVAVHLNGEEVLARIRPSDYIWHVSCAYLGTDAGYHVYGDLNTRAIFAVESVAEEGIPEISN